MAKTLSQCRNDAIQCLVRAVIIKDEQTRIKAALVCLENERKCALTATDRLSPPTPTRTMKALLKSRAKKSKKRP